MATTLNKTREARKIFNQIKELDNMSNLLYWERAKFLYELSKDNLYKNVFGEDGSGSWNSFCAQANLSVSSSKQKIKVYETFVIKLKLDPKKDLLGLDTSGLYYIHLSKRDITKSEVMEWLGKLRDLSRGDFLQELRGNGDCSHEHTKEETVVRCEHCSRTLGTHKK